MASMLDGLPSIFAAAIMVPIQLLVNLLINSGSGQAAATMPIMAPLADILGVSRQTAVLADVYKRQVYYCTLFFIVLLKR